MIHYTFFTKDLAGGDGPRRKFFCADDAAAIEMARNITESGQQCDIWDGTRFVARIAMPVDRP